MRFKKRATKLEMDVNKSYVPKRPLSSRTKETTNQSNDLEHQLSNNAVASLVDTLSSTSLSSSGQPLDFTLQAQMSAQLGDSFADARIHTDKQAKQSARDLGARAYTIGHHIVLGQAAPKLNSDLGKQLLAHELTHVMQQRGAQASSTPQIASPASPYEHEAIKVANNIDQTTQPIRPQLQLPRQAIQRQPIQGGGATPGQGTGVDLIFIIRADTDQFTADITKYVKTVLKGQAYQEVNNVEEIFAHLKQLRGKGGQLSPQSKVRRIRIVAHGSTTGDVKMTPVGEKARRWVSPATIKKFAEKQSTRSIAKAVMATGAQVEFWGCNIGGIQEAGEAWSSLFGSNFTATSETVKTGFVEYYRHAETGEKGKTFPGNQGSWVRVKHTSEVDARNKGLQKHFRAWLLARYQELADNGDIPRQANKAAKIKYMRALFDRSSGEIKYLQIERQSDSELIRPGQSNKWMKLWKRYTITP